MTCQLIRISCLFALLTSAGTAMSAETNKAPDRYEVELILFRHVDQSRNTPEIPAASSIFSPSPFDLTPGDVPAQTPIILDESGQQPHSNLLIVETGVRNRRPPIGFYILELDPAFPDFVPLHKDTFRLGRAYNRLVKIDAYEPLMHIGWIQPARNTDESKPYRFEPSTTDETGISGTITLYKERFLHLEIDLSLETESRPVRTPLFPGPGNSETPDVFKLTESRRIRGTTTHYFDSPQFGLITRVHEVRAAAAERKETG